MRLVREPGDSRYDQALWLHALVTIDGRLVSFCLAVDTDDGWVEVPATNPDGTSIYQCRRQDGTWVDHADADAETLAQARWIQWAGKPHRSRVVDANMRLKRTRLTGTVAVCFPAMTPEETAHRLAQIAQRIEKE
jgi:hypothetical protein